jgi:hypothetical protein
MAELTGAELHPDALAEVQPLLDHLESDPALQFSFYMALLSLITEEISEFSTENQGYYAAWLSGTMDFMIQPLPIDDEVHTVSKISALWGIPRPEEAEAAGMPHALLGWTGNTTTLSNSVCLFDALGGGDGPNWAEEELGAPGRAHLQPARAHHPRGGRSLRPSRWPALLGGRLHRLPCRSPRLGHRLRGPRHAAPAPPPCR